MKKILSLTLTLALLILTCCTALTVSAAAPSVSVSASGTSVTVGSTVKVTVKYTADAIGAFDATMSYNDAVLQYVSAAGNGGALSANGGAGLVRFSNYLSSAAKTYTFTVTFKAKATGSTDVKLQTQDLVDFNTVQTVGTPSGSVKINVQNPSLSGNANLTELYISSGKLSPAFSANVTSYNIEIPYAVTVLTVSVNTADKNAKVDVTGSKQMKVGKNTRVIKVTAPNGTVKSYTLNITRLENDGTATEGTTPAVESSKVTVGDQTKYIAKELKNIAIPAGYEQTTVTINDTLFPAVQNAARSLTLLYLTDDKGANGAFYTYNSADMTFSQFIGATDKGGVYALLTPDNTVTVPDGCTQSFIEIEGKTVVAWSFPDPAMSTYHLVYATSPAGNTGLYLYDTLEATFQRYTAMTATVIETEEDVPAEESSSFTAWFGKVKTAVVNFFARLMRLGSIRVVAIGIGVGLLLVGIVFGIILLVNRPRNYKH